MAPSNHWTERNDVRTFTDLAELEAAVGEELGTTDWMEITQERVNAFADATGDHQYIHVDPERAAKTMFGGPIAHGYLTLSMLPLLNQDREGIKIDLGGKMGVNYGLNRVRFPTPVPAGARLRAHIKLLKFEPLDGGAQLTTEVTVELDGSAKPACVAEFVSRSYTQS
jgi:acyl dehydratase